MVPNGARKFGQRDYGITVAANWVLKRGRWIDGQLIWSGNVGHGKQTHPKTFVAWFVDWMG